MWFLSWMWTSGQDVFRAGGQTPCWTAALTGIHLQAGLGTGCASRAPDFGPGEPTRTPGSVQPPLWSSTPSWCYMINREEKGPAGNICFIWFNFDLSVLAACVNWRDSGDRCSGLPLVCPPRPHPEAPPQRDTSVPPEEGVLNWLKSCDKRKSVKFGCLCTAV